MAAISEKIVESLPAPAKGNRLHYFSGATLQGKKAPAGFAVRVTSSGTKSFCWYHRVGGKPFLETLGRWDENAKGGGLTVLQAIIAAKDRADAIRNDRADPRPERTRRIEDADKPKGETVGEMLDEYLDRYATKERKLRSVGEIRSVFERLVKPAIGKLGLYDLGRSEIKKMLDRIADENGLVMADRTLAYVRSAFNWQESWDDKFKSPIAKRMAKTKPKERARTRVLSDDEIRDLWRALDGFTKPACYSAFVKTLLFTGARLREVSNMRWSEIDGGAWTIPAARYKTKVDHTIPLTKTARDLIGRRPDEGHAKYPFVFSTSTEERPHGEKAFSGFSKAKRLLDRQIATIRESEGRSPMPAWTPHDLRRTARTLMSRAGVNTDHAERCLGHVIGGVREVYDRHKFEAEKKAAFEALEALIARILKPTENVSELAGRRKGAG
jgi:integrase